MLKKYLPFIISASWFPGLVFAIHCILSLGFKAYDRLPLLDIPMHLLGGAAIAYFFHVSLVYFDELGFVRIGDRTVELIMVFGLVATSTVIWEFAEFLADFFFHVGAQRSLENTMKDQFNGLVGGIAYIGIFSRGDLTKRFCRRALSLWSSRSARGTA